MVRPAGGDHLGPVELLQKHHPEQVVGEGHGGEGEPQVRLPLEGLVQAVGAADDEGHPGRLGLLQGLGEGGA